MATSSVAYILRASDRTAETSIANEIRLLRDLGIPVRRYSIPTSGTNRQALWSAHCRVASARPALYWSILREAPRLCMEEFADAVLVADDLLRRPGVVHLHAHFCDASVAMFVSRLTDLPFSFTADGKDIGLRDARSRDLLQRHLQLAAFAVTATATHKAYLDAIRSPESSPVHTIYRSLDLSPYAPRRHSRPSGPIRILAGAQREGLLCLLDACAQLRDRGYDFECLIAGAEDGYRPELERRISSLELGGRVELRPAGTREELLRLYSESAIFVFPRQAGGGDCDGIPDVLAGAMAMELAVVSANTSGIAEIVQSGENGLLVPPGDASALAAALMDYIEFPRLRMVLGRAARRTVLNVFDARRNAQKLALLFGTWMHFPVRHEESEAVRC